METKSVTTTHTEAAFVRLFYILPDSSISYLLRTLLTQSEKKNSVTFHLKGAKPDVEKAIRFIKCCQEKSQSSGGQIFKKEIMIFGDSFQLKEFHGQTGSIFNDMPQWELMSDSCLDEFASVDLLAHLLNSVQPKIMETIDNKWKDGESKKFEIRFGLPIVTKAPEMFFRQTFSCEDLEKSLPKKKGGTKYFLEPQSRGLWTDHILRGIIAEEYREVVDMTINDKNVAGKTGNPRITWDPHKKKVIVALEVHGKDFVDDLIAPNRVNCMRLSLDRFKSIPVDSLDPALIKILEGIDFGKIMLGKPISEKMSERYTITHVRYKVEHRYDCGDYMVKCRDVWFETDEDTKKIVVQRPELEITSRSLNDLLRGTNENRRRVLEIFPEEFKKMLIPALQMFRVHNATGSIDKFLSPSDHKARNFSPQRIKITKIPNVTTIPFQSIGFGVYRSGKFEKQSEMNASIDIEGDRDTFQIFFNDSSKTRLKWNVSDMQTCVHSSNKCVFTFNVFPKVWSRNERCMVGRHNFKSFCAILGQQDLLKLPFIPSAKEILFKDVEKEDRDVSKSILPVVPESAQGLSFGLKWSLLGLLSWGLVEYHQFNNEFFDYVENAKFSDIILQQMVDKREYITNLLETFKTCEKFVSSRPILGKHLSRVRKIVITPSHMYFNTGNIQLSNSIIKDREDDFFIVSFRDENFEMYRPHDYNDIVTSWRRKLDGKWKIVGEEFEFLLPSNSQLRNCSCWFVNTKLKLDLNSFGKFNTDESLPKRVARMGHLFTASWNAFTLKKDEWDVEKDIKHDGRVFSDGIGRISTTAMKELCSSLGLIYGTISTVQIRVGGFKGVLCEDPLLTSHKVIFRKSQYKFEFQTSDIDIRVVKLARWAQCKLTKESILLLEHLGVTEDVFMDKFNEDIQKIQDKVTNYDLPQYPYVQSKASLLTKFPEDPYTSCLKSAILRRMMEDLRHMRVNVAKGACLMGVIDEYNELKEDEVVITIKKPWSNDHVIITGDVVLIRHPSRHPGDIRKAKAVQSDKHSHLCNVVVFPTTGKIPLASQCSGGDYDGDEWHVIWDKDLVPPKTLPPFDYDTIIPTRVAKIKKAISCDEIKDWFFEYSLIDRMGILANQHLASCDAKGVDHEDTLSLAIECAKAVDYAKSGVPGTLSPALKTKTFPRWMELYPSYTHHTMMQRIHYTITEFTQKDHFIISDDIIPSQELIVDGHEKWLEDAKFHFGGYKNEMESLCKRHGVANPFDLLVCNLGTSVEMNATSYNARNLQLAINEIDTRFVKIMEETTDLEARRARSSAWYVYAYMAEKDLRFLPFGWICLENVPKKGNRDRSSIQIWGI
jgi:hypothetical protein